MTIFEHLFLNIIPLFIAIYVILWLLDLSRPIDRFVLRIFKRETIQAPPPLPITPKVPDRPSSKRMQLVAMPAQEKVLFFARQYLDQDAISILQYPFQPQAMEHEGWSEMRDYFNVNGLQDMTDSVWGQLLVSVLIEDGMFIEWMDWKYNVPTLLLENEYDDLLNKLFVKRGLPPVTLEERQSVLVGYPDNIDYDLYSQSYLELSELQPIAAKRGHQLLQIFNNSDQSLLIALPFEDAELWNDVEIGEVSFQSD